MEHTPNPVPQKENRACSILVAVRGEVVHVARGCEHHVKEFVEMARELKSDETFSIFRDDAGGFCSVCYRFSWRGRSVNTLLYQIPVETWKLGAS